MSDAGEGDVTHDEVAAVTSEEHITDRVKEYLKPDANKIPDDASAASATED